MKRRTFIVYGPPTPGTPWLALTLEGNRPVDMLGCPDEETAQRVLIAMKARWSGKNAQALAHSP